MKTKAKAKPVRSRRVTLFTKRRAVEATELTDEQWRAAARRGLARLGLSYDDLQSQADTGRFASPEALKMWRVLGGERP